MLKASGKSVCGGVAIGPMHVLKRNEQQVKRAKVSDNEAEIARFRQAKESAFKQLQDLYQKALTEVGQVNAAIFEMHQMMLEDGDYTESIESIIRTQSVNAEYAVASTADNFAGMFAQMDDEYMRERAADVKDISERVLNLLQGGNGTESVWNEPAILVADDLAPSQTVQMDKEKVLAFVTVHGSLNSHTAILARTMGIPALVGVKIDLEELKEGAQAIVDGIEGSFYVQPEEAFVQQMREKREAEVQKKELLKELKGKETITGDGRKVMLYANIGNPKDLPAALQNDAEGIGLFRSEFLYLESDHFPTEEEQFQAYKSVAEAMAGKRVIIRTMDIGADKKCDYFGLEQEENPALGYRGIRICLMQPEIFKTQLRAIYRASAFGKIAIMYPMIISVSEVEQIKAIVEEVKRELDNQGFAYQNPEQGVMIETPAAVYLSGELAKHVDFFSIGTNDLTQYTLAIDRQNPKLDAFYDAHHPAVLAMIEMVVKSAHEAGIWAGICGELAADTTLTKRFVEMGVDELSVSANSILPIRKIIREC